MFFVLGIIWATLIEWLIHRFILHDLASKLKASYHLEHHFIAAKSKGLDSDYDTLFLKSSPRIKEVVGLIFVLFIHCPIIFLSIEFFLGNLFITLLYYFIHKIVHKNIEFGWRWVPWHMQHHLISAKKNFGVTTPLWDWVFGTLIICKK